MDPMDPLDTLDPFKKNTKLMYTRHSRFGDSVRWNYSDGSIGHPLDSLDMSIEHRKWIQWIHWIPLENFTDGLDVQWTRCPMDTVSNGNNVQ